MAELLFDTMAAVRRLRDTGMEERQAEAIASTIRDGLTGGVVTKPDILELRAALKDDVVGLESRLKGKIAGLESRLKDDMVERDARLRDEIAVLRDDMAVLKDDMVELRRATKQVKWIAGAILAVLMLPWLAKLLSVAT